MKETLCDKCGKSGATSYWLGAIKVTIFGEVPDQSTAEKRDLCDAHVKEVRDLFTSKRISVVDS